jgi:hypothetical protein
MIYNDLYNKYIINKYIYFLYNNVRAMHNFSPFLEIAG